MLTPSHLLLLPLDQKKAINLTNLNDIGLSSLQESTSFRKINIFTKSTKGSIFNSTYETQPQTTRLYELAKGSNSFFQSPSYAIQRQLNFASPLTNSLANRFNLDKTSFMQFLDFSLDQQNKKPFFSST